MANQMEKSGIRTARRGLLLAVVWSAVGLGWTGIPLAAKDRLEKGEILKVGEALQSKNGACKFILQADALGVVSGDKALWGDNLHPNAEYLSMGYFGSKAFLVAYDKNKIPVWINESLQMSNTCIPKYLEHRSTHMKPEMKEFAPLFDLEKFQAAPLSLVMHDDGNLIFYRGSDCHWCSKWQEVSGSRLAAFITKAMKLLVPAPVKLAYEILEEKTQ